MDPPPAAAFRLSVCLRPSLPSGCVSAAGWLPPVGLRLTPPPRSVRLSQARPPSFSPVGFSVSGPPILFVFGLPCLLCLWIPLPRSRRVSLESPGRSPAAHCSSIPFLLQASSVLSVRCVCPRMLSRSPHRSPVSSGHLPSLTPPTASLTASSLLDCPPPHNSHGLLPNVALRFGGPCSQICLPLYCPCHPSPPAPVGVPLALLTFFFFFLPLQPP